MSGQPGGFHDATTAEIDGHAENIRLRTVFTDEEYLPAFDMKLIAGRNFTKDLRTDANRTAILNEKSDQWTLAGPQRKPLDKRYFWECLTL